MSVLSCINWQLHRKNSCSGASHNIIIISCSLLLFILYGHACANLNLQIDPACTSECDINLAALTIILVYGISILGAIGVSGWSIGSSCMNTYSEYQRKSIL